MNSSRTDAPVGVPKPLFSYRKHWAKRFGTAAEFGGICAFLCSQHGGYITGQNILADGGAYPGTM